MTVKQCSKICCSSWWARKPKHVIWICQLNSHESRGVLAHQMHLCVQSQSVCFNEGVLTGCEMCADRCSYIDIYNNKVADCKHQVTAKLEAFLVYYSILFNHRGWEFTGPWCHLFLPAGDGGGWRWDRLWPHLSPCWDISQGSNRQSTSN